MEHRFPGRRSGWNLGIWSVLPICVLVVLWVCQGDSQALAQDEGAAIPDSMFTLRPHQPINYYTSYDRNVSRASWLQTLSYAQTAKRVAFNFSATTIASNGLRGLRSDGLDGDVNGSLTFVAAKQWTWALDGRFGRNSNNDDFSSTDRRQNRLQLRTQYQFNPLHSVTAMALLFAELQQDQSVGERTIPVAPTQGYVSHVGRDSSYTNGQRGGASGTLTWKPAPWVEVGGTGVTTRINTTTNTMKQDFFNALFRVAPTARLSPVPFLVPDSTSETLENTKSPNGDERLDTHITYTGIRRTTVGLVLRTNSADQQYYALTQRAQENYRFGARAAAFHVETVPFASSQAVIDVGVDRGYRDYRLQRRLNSLTHGANAAGQFNVYRPQSRVAVGFLFTRAKADSQITQNGVVINRAVNASGARRMSRRLWLDGAGSVSLFTRQYIDAKSDKDDVRGYLNTGGGYLVSDRCSTTVHFSVTRSHAVAIAYGSSGGNNVQTSYQMDAALRLQASRNLWIYQNYQLNANYLIYDYDEKRNTLTRIRRIDTTLIDSLFSFASIRLIHNFFFQDRGAYARFVEGGPREYSVDQEIYAQNLSVGISIGIWPGVSAAATQSLANSRSYFPNPGLNTNRNRWNLNLGVTVDRALPGAIRLNGAVQRIGEYTENPGPKPPLDVVDYWLAGITLTKDF